MNPFEALAHPPIDRPGDPFPRVYNPWGLTPAQCEILRLMALGKSQTEVAQRHHLSPKTVSSQLLRAREKMAVSSVGQAVLLWDRHFNRKS